MKFAILTPSNVYISSIFKYTTMGQTIPKEMKYNLHYGTIHLSNMKDYSLLNMDILIKKKKKKLSWKQVSKRYRKTIRLKMAVYIMIIYA